MKKCFSVCGKCGRNVICNYTHRYQKVFCTQCNKQIFSYIIVEA